MIHSLMMIGSLKESDNRPDDTIRLKRNKSVVVRRIQLQNMFSLKRVRNSAVYALLIASILLSLLTAFLTYELNNDSALGLRNAESNIQQSISKHRNNSIFTSVSFFVLLTLTFSLISIRRRDKINTRLLSKLKSKNRQLNNEVQIRTSELTEAIRAKDHFMGVAAHDLKAPLSGIEGLVELIKMENKNMPASQAEYLGHIQYSCKKMQRLIIDILDINRIEQGNAKMNWQKVNIMPIVSQLQLSFDQHAAKKDIDLQIEGIDAIIETDPDGLSRVLENLLSNAIKFSYSGKSVSLRTSLEHNQIKFKVSDEGPGIPQEEQPRLFSKFQRLSNRPTSSEISTGLGLSIVKELTTQLGGEITFKSEVGKGSIFIVTLPQFKRSDGLSKKRKQEHPVRLRQPYDQVVEEAFAMT